MDDWYLGGGGWVHLLASQRVELVLLARCNRGPTLGLGLQPLVAVAAGGYYCVVGISIPMGDWTQDETFHPFVRGKSRLGRYL